MDNQIEHTANKPEIVYDSIRSFVITAQNKVYTAVNAAMAKAL